MSDFKDLYKALAEGIKTLFEAIKNEPLLAFIILSVIVVALFNDKIPPEMRPFIYAIIGVGVVVYAIRVLVPTLRKPAPSADKPAPADKKDSASPPAAPPPAPVPSADPRGAYLDAVIADCRPARLVGLDPQAADPSRGTLSLEQLYISLDTKTQVKVEEGEERKKGRAEPGMDREQTRPLPALEALAQAPDRRMVLLGLPGSGKSTLVRYLALEMAQGLCDPAFDLSKRLPGWRGQPLVPLIIPLGRLAESFPAETRKGEARLVEQFVRTTLDADARTHDYAPRALATLRDTGGLVFFDGLDEVADPNRRPLVRQAVEDFANRYGKHPATRFLVTCRTFSYTDARWQFTNWQTHELASLTEDKINQFVEAWYGQHAQIDPRRADDYERKRAMLVKALHRSDRRRLHVIADNPLILTVMAVVHTHYGELPDTRAQVYDRCIDLLLLRWELERSIDGQKHKRSILDDLAIPRGQLDDALLELAYKAHAGREASDGDQTALVTEELITGVLKVHLRDLTKVQAFLDYCEGSNGLLMLQGEVTPPDAPPNAPLRRVYTFPHLTFEEYLAGRYLEQQRNLGPRVRERLDENSDRWREVVMLLGEHLCFARGDWDRMDSILAALVPEAPPQREADWRALWLAGDLLLLYRRRFANVHPAPAEPRIRERLVRLVETGALTPRERAAAANALAELDDPRPGIGVIVPPPLSGERPSLPEEKGAPELRIPDLVWCEIPAGPFIMGSSKNKNSPHFDPGADNYEIEASEYAKLTRPYYIARYPTTNAQFDAFVEDPQGYRQAQWWTRSGLQWRKDRQGPKKFGGVFDLPNHPVVYVTWYEAVAFANWLNDRLQATGGRSQNSILRLQVWEKGSIVTRDLDPGQFQVRLPTEAEWEKGARGTEGRIYPWGANPDPNRANYGDTGLNTTSAVGAFPGGTSPYGVLDMSGNVWEWCATQWTDNYENYAHHEKNELEGDAPRVWRGGSFFYSRDYVRCAARLGRDPDLLPYNMGFRVALSPIRL
ncbi:MAG: SUMF1/EgtB/PvdO family nonheme iron enzyme [Anaerolineae bacterium]